MQLDYFHQQGTFLNNLYNLLYFILSNYVVYSYFFFILPHSEYDDFQRCTLVLRENIFNSGSVINCGIKIALGSLDFYVVYNSASFIFFLFVNLRYSMRSLFSIALLQQMRQLFFQLHC